MVEESPWFASGNDGKGGRAASVVFAGDPVNPANGTPYEILPGAPLVTPGADGRLGTDDDVIDQARVLVNHVNRDNHLEVRWDIDASIPPLVTDSLKLEEILQNLIGNAFKFTPAGRIEVRVQNRPEQDRVEFIVADTGIGIAAEDQGRIFDAFEQLKEAHTGNFNGVGLGLNIVRRYLDLMQGKIFVQSEPGQGAKFTFSVPRSLQLNS